VSLVTPQRWKLWLWAALFTLSGAGIFVPDLLAAAIGASPVLVLAGAIALVIIVLVGVSLSIRCPACGLKLAWHALSKHAQHRWLAWLLDVRTCPKCGFSHAQADPENAAR
jgi:endogenous inhibitor of DNA gyrase (YacG/DUF329 family)